MMAPAPAVFPALVLLALTLYCSQGEAACFLERGVTSPGEQDVYTCWRSKDFRKDLNRLPLNHTNQINVSFLDGKVKKIEKEDLQKLGTKALGLSVVHCGLEEVDGEAFRGLTELKALVLRRNSISVVKEQWFTDLDKLESLDLSSNKIQEFDSDIFKLIPLIQEFDISDNLLKKFDVETMKTKWTKIKKVSLQWNPYEWEQGVKLIDYLNEQPSIAKNSCTSIDGIRETAKLVKECQNTIAKKDDAKELDNCINAKLAKAIESPKMLKGEEPVETSTPTQ